MCSICGILDANHATHSDALAKMSAALRHRGPDQRGDFVQGPVHFAHNRLSIMDPANGLQPMTRVWAGRRYVIVYNGELYNSEELRRDSQAKGLTPATQCDTELVLFSYILYGNDCARHLNGIFAFAVYDEAEDAVYIARDRLGVKPLFYAEVSGLFLFASEIKGLLAHPAVSAKVDERGLWQLLFLAPCRLNGGIFRDISELQPGYSGVWQNGSFAASPYWTLSAEPCVETRDEVIEHTRSLLSDAIVRQLDADVPLCTLLSGGLDSSIVSALAADTARARGDVLSTYSFQYMGNETAFRSTLFQPESDDAYALYMAEQLNTAHHVLTADTTAMVDRLLPATLARDFPGQADIDASLLVFCEEIKKNHTVALSGECADELFGGYPWFYREEMLERPFFPWIHRPMLRPSLFQTSFAKPASGYAYLGQQYAQCLAQCPTLDTDDGAMRRSRLATWLSMQFFMGALLERKDRMSMACGLEVRVPFADHRLWDYVFNVPWSIKYENGVEKALLRNAMAPYLPARVLHRKKSPYPKTQNPDYEAQVRVKLRDRLAQKGSVLRELLDLKALAAYLDAPEETWFGQLMGRPQLLSWLLQFDDWATAYRVDFV